MRLVIQFDVAGVRETLPIEYASAEQFSKDLDRALHEAFDTMWHVACVGPYRFAPAPFFKYSYDAGKIVFMPPTVLTVDDWFTQNQPQSKV